jgi:predicted anti-sigma-YlaC factor YlaD
VDCQSIVALLSAELDGGLSADESQAVRTHLVLCADCARRFALLNDTRQAYRASMHKPPPRRGYATAAALVAAAVAVIVVGIVVMQTPDRSSPQLRDASAVIPCGITDSRSCSVEVPPCSGAECALVVPQ